MKEGEWIGEQIAIPFSFRYYKQTV